MRCWISNNSPFSVLLLNLLQWKVCFHPWTFQCWISHSYHTFMHIHYCPFRVGALNRVIITGRVCCMGLVLSEKYIVCNHLIFLKRSCDRFCCVSCLVCMIFFAQFPSRGGIVVVLWVCFLYLSLFVILIKVWCSYLRCFSLCFCIFCLSTEEV